jgi:hypothetical protein
MPKRYRITLILYDEEENERRQKSHEETYEDDAQAFEGFDEKDRAARKAGKPHE